MKRLTIFLVFISMLIFAATTRAFLQENLRPRLETAGKAQSAGTTPDAMPGSHLNHQRLHKLMLDNRDGAVYEQLLGAKAIRQEVNYGSYKLLVIDQEALGGRAAVAALQATPRDDQNMIALNGYLLDTSNSQPLAVDIPAQLKQSRMSAAPVTKSAPGGGLYLVQFVGPIQDVWLKALEGTGARIVSYVPNNAYVVHADDRSAAELAQLKERLTFVQWVGDYEPAYKLTPGLRAASAGAGAQSIKVTVQVIDSEEGQKLIEELKAASTQDFAEARVLDYRNVTVSIPVPRLAELARRQTVFAVGEVHQIERADEAQGQIVAGNRSGNTPNGPGYLAWLASKGFNSSQFSSFAVNVVDDSISLAGHPDLPESRVAFQNNPTLQYEDRSYSHGYLNAHIVGGHNDRTGPLYEDINGYNYGLGIAPWARVGLTGIFGYWRVPFPNEWEQTAYEQNARISTNSWGSGLVDGGPPTYGFYDQMYDSIVRDAHRGIAGNQEMIVVFAAGNSGRSGDSTVWSPGTAKNVITVGASENVRTGTDGCGIGPAGADSANDIADFSSRGPVNPAGGDGRIKPDLVAPGTHIQAGAPQSNYPPPPLSYVSTCDWLYPVGQSLYTWSSGTSHAAPAVAGGAALIYQHFLNQGLAAPSPAMVKAMLMNSASYLTGAGANDTLPSKSQGMGLLDLGRAFDGTSRLLTDETKTFHSTGETHYVYGSVAASNQPLRITLAWSDAPGPVTGAPYVNNLDLELVINGQVYKGNVFSGANSTPGGAADGKNNVESIFLPAGVSGNFLVTIKATNIAGDGVPGDSDKTDQDFALVISNANSAAAEAPIIDATPSNLSFTTLVEINPAGQSFNVGNAGSGTLAWTAGDDAPWLTLGATSGNAPAAIPVSVNVSGLTPGTYTANITLTSPGAFNTPVVVPVTLTVRPVFTVTPSALLFVAGVTTGNPADQTIKISPNDATLPGYTVSDNASWLTVTPATGSAPTTLKASVNISGLTIGAYTATISLQSSTAALPPTHIPVTLVITATANSGFEQIIDPWVASGVAMRSSGAYVNSGNSYLLLGAADASRGVAYQDVSLPSNTSAKLSFQLNVESKETTTTERKDKLFVEVRDPQGRLLSRLTAFSNLNATRPGSYALRGVYDLSGFAGQRIRLQFRVVTDDSSPTTFRVDDVWIK